MTKKKTFLTLVLIPLFLRPEQMFAVIAGRDAEATAVQLEKKSQYRNAAVWRLVAARAFRELIIPCEVENVRAFTQIGDLEKARICANRVQIQYPEKVRENLAGYERDLRMTSGTSVREAVEREAVAILSKMAPIPIAVPTRLSTVESEEKKGNWAKAADYRELSARIYLLVTVPFFERESDRAPDNQSRVRFRAESAKYLQSARENFLSAAENYRRAAQRPKRDAVSTELAEFYRRKTAEMDTEAKALSILIDSRGTAK